MLRIGKGTFTCSIALYRAYVNWHSDNHLSAKDIIGNRILTRLFKEMVHLNSMRYKLMELLKDVIPFNKSKKVAEIKPC